MEISARGLWTLRKPVEKTRQPGENPSEKTRQPELSAFLIGRLGLSRDAVPGKSRSSG
jgi:hypothetical protein